jgi:hypothetical protein
MQLEHMSGTEIFAIANPIMDNIMDASTAIDHERHRTSITVSIGSGRADHHFFLRTSSARELPSVR